MSRIIIILDILLGPLYVFARLARMNMTIFSAVTYSVACTMALHVLGEAAFSPRLFVAGYLFLLMCQLVAHLLGEFYDYRSDLINFYSSPMTGGSKLTISGKFSEGLCLVFGYCCFFAACIILFYHLPARCIPIGLVMLFLAHQYSAPPFKFNHRALGELCAAIVMNILLPWFSAIVQSESFLHIEHASCLLVLIIPSTLLKFSLFLALNMADRRPDWAAGKITLPVILGDRRTSQLMALINVLAYVSVIVLWALGLASTLGLVLIMATAPAAIRITEAFNPAGRLPYKLDPLVGQWLRFAPSVVLAVFLDFLLRELGASAAAAYTSAATEETSMATTFAAAAWAVVCKCFSFVFQLRLLPLYPFVYNAYIYRWLYPVVVRPPTEESLPPKLHMRSIEPVIIVGGGIGGLVLGITLQKLGICVTIYEKGNEDSSAGGADLALWPAAIKALKALGVGDGTSLFSRQTYPVHRVYMTALRPDGSEEILRKVDMDAVVRNTGESFCLVERSALINALRAAIAPGTVIYQTKVIEVYEDLHRRWATLEAVDHRNRKIFPMASVVVGADGIRSVCRETVLAYHGMREPPIRFGGEVCHRGLVDLQRTPWLRSIFDAKEAAQPGSMNIVYGPSVRFSYGYINSERTRGYWFVKEQSAAGGATAVAAAAATAAAAETGPSGQNKPWPEPVATFRRMQQEEEEGRFRADGKEGGCSHAYVHDIHDCPPLKRWSSVFTTLIGDACHTVTPNNGQGACMAIEDAFVLGTLLRKHWNCYDGQLEAFYEYERARRDHCARIHAESHKQMKIGQLSHPTLVWLRNKALSLVPAKIFESKLRRDNVFEISSFLKMFDELLVSEEKADGVIRFEGGMRVE